MKTYEDILQECDDICEDANYHDFGGLATEIFEALKSHIDEKDYKKVAKKIKDCIINKI